jgi:hypothetical protein
MPAHKTLRARGLDMVILYVDFLLTRGLLGLYTPPRDCTVLATGSLARRALFNLNRYLTVFALTLNIVDISIRQGSAFVRLSGDLDSHTAIRRQASSSASVAPEAALQKARYRKQCRPVKP